MAERPGDGHVNTDEVPLAGALVVLSHSPYGGPLARAALDTVMAGAVFDQPVALLLRGAGVLAALPDQDGQSVGRRSAGKIIGSLPYYDVETLYLDAEATAAYGLDIASLPVQARLLDRSSQRALLTRYRHILGY